MFSNCFFFQICESSGIQMACPLDLWLFGVGQHKTTSSLCLCLTVHEFSTGICLFILFIYLFISSFCLFLLTNSLLSPSFSANLPSVLKHYLVLLSSISFIVILSKHYLFFVLMYYIVKVNFFPFLFGNKACCCCCCCLPQSKTEISIWPCAGLPVCRREKLNGSVKDIQCTLYFIQVSFVKETTYVSFMNHLWMPVVQKSIA